jgi:hypothetical protein
VVREGRPRFCVIGRRPPTNRQSLSSGMCFVGVCAHGGRVVGGTLCSARCRAAVPSTTFFATNRFRGFRPWSRVAKTDSRQTWAMRRPPSRQSLHKRRMRGGWRRRPNARSDSFVPSSTALIITSNGWYVHPSAELCAGP